MGALWHGPDLAVSAAAAREKRGLFGVSWNSCFECLFTSQSHYPFPLITTALNALNHQTLFNTKTLPSLDFLMNRNCIWSSLEERVWCKGKKWRGGGRMVVLLFRNVHESQDPFTPEVMTWSLKPSTQWSTCTGFLFFMLRFFCEGYSSEPVCALFAIHYLAMFNKHNGRIFVQVALKMNWSWQGALLEVTHRLLQCL